jgi:hypothetical protein
VSFGGISIEFMNKSIVIPVDTSLTAELPHVNNEPICRNCITDDIYQVCLSKLSITRSEILYGDADMPRNTVSRSDGS